jgi:hypothetical protein
MQLRNPGEGRADFDRKKAAGKASMEALRCLERRLSDIVYRQLRSTPSGSQERVREDTRYDKDDQPLFFGYRQSIWAHTSSPAEERNPWKGSCRQLWLVVNSKQAARSDHE